MKAKIEAVQAENRMKNEIILRRKGEFFTYLSADGQQEHMRRVDHMEMQLKDTFGDVADCWRFNYCKYSTMWLTFAVDELIGVKEEVLKYIEAHKTDT